MKIGWGAKIAAVYTCFALFMLFMVYKSSTLNIDLVTDNYYQEEIAYQDKIDQIKMSKDLDKTLVIDYNSSSEEIQLSFPQISNKYTGNVLLYRPSDASLDRYIELDLQNGADWYFDASSLASGLWKVQVEWLANGKSYFNEETLMLP